MENPNGGSHTAEGESASQNGTDSSGLRHVMLLKRVDWLKRRIHQLKIEELAVEKFNETILIEDEEILRERIATLSDTLWATTVRNNVEDIAVKRLLLAHLQRHIFAPVAGAPIEDYISNAIKDKVKKQTTLSMELLEVDKRVQELKQQVAEFRRKYAELLEMKRELLQTVSDEKAKEQQEAELLEGARIQSMKKSIANVTAQLKIVCSISLKLLADGDTNWVEDPELLNMVMVMGRHLDMENQ